VYVTFLNSKLAGYKNSNLGRTYLSNKKYKEKIFLSKLLHTAKNIMPTTLFSSFFPSYGKMCKSFANKIAC
jgi:hypothetical protein